LLNDSKINHNTKTVPKNATWLGRVCFFIFFPLLMTAPSTHLSRAARHLLLLFTLLLLPLFTLLLLPLFTLLLLPLFTLLLLPLFTLLLLPLFTLLLPTLFTLLLLPLLTLLLLLLTLLLMEDAFSSSSFRSIFSSAASACSLSFSSSSFSLRAATCSTRVKRHTPHASVSV